MTATILALPQRNDRTIQDRVCRGLEELGVPSARNQVVVQAQRRDLDLIVRVRWLSFRVRRRSQGLNPVSEHRFQSVNLRPTYQLIEFIDGIAKEALILLRAEFKRQEFKWPDGWPRVEYDLRRTGA